MKDSVDAQGVMLSVVIPMYNERDNVHALLSLVMRALRDCASVFEIIVVDDHSTDGTFETLRQARDIYCCLRIVRLSRNFGHQAAVLAGLNEASGQAIITMDGDLQHPPELIADLVKEWRRGFDVVHAVRLDEFSKEKFWKRWTSRGFYAVLRVNSGMPIRAGMADYRLVSRRALDSVLAMRETAPFLRGIFLWIGFDQSFVPYVPGARVAGKSEYTLTKMLRLARDGIVSFSSLPLYWCFIIGIIVSGLSISYGLYAICIKLVSDAAIPGWASLAALMSLLFGLMFTMIGLLGVYVGAIHTELKKRPPYIVSEQLDAASSEASAHDAVSLNTDSRPGTLRGVSG